MFLNSLLKKPLVFRQRVLHVCIGVGISKKSGTIKYLICLHEEQHIEFALPYNHVTSITNNGIIVSSLRSAIIKHAYVIKPELPVYSTQGKYIGNLEDAVLFKNTLTQLIIRHHTYPFACISGILDAILLSPKQPYPLGQRIVNHKKKANDIITKNTLKKAIAENKLIALTLSLPPFNLSINP